MSNTSFDEYLRTKVFIKAFVKGPMGSGKTFIAAAATQVWKTLYIDVEGGLHSAFPVVNKDNIEVRCIPSKDSDPEEFFGRLADAVTLAESGQFECVVLDSITEVSGRMEDDYSRKSANGKLEFGDWYVLQERLRRLCRRLKDIPCHIIITSLTKTTGKEDSSAIFEALLSGQSSAMIPSFFDTVGLMRKLSSKGAIEYVLTTDGPSIYQVRDRIRALAPEERVTEQDASVVWRKLQAGIHALSGCSLSGAPATKA